MYERVREEQGIIRVIPARQCRIVQTEQSFGERVHWLTSMLIEVRVIGHRGWTSPRRDVGTEPGPSPLPLLFDCAFGGRAFARPPFLSFP